jgi:putative ABC transport system ATP-binding protein
MASQHGEQLTMQLAVDGIAFSYGSTPVLKDASFTLAAGEHALLLGPSGSGKSSLLNIICGLQTPARGSVTLGGEAVSDGVRKAHMGVVFQTLRLVSALSVKGNLLLAQKLSSGAQDDARVDAILEQLGIAHRTHARPHELSQGEAQRAAIARALVITPGLLIADEPTSALDKDNTANVATMLIEAAKDAGASLLIATHDDRLATHFERTLKLEDGQVL